jgi:hypothetical protein
MKLRVLSKKSFLFGFVFLFGLFLSCATGKDRNDPHRRLQRQPKFNGYFAIVKAGISEAKSLSEVKLGVYRNGAVINIAPFQNISLSLYVGVRRNFTSHVNIRFQNRINRNDTTAPYSVGGNFGPNFNPVPELNMAGIKFVRATGYNSGSDLLVHTIRFRFRMVNSVPSAVPVLQPVTQPIAVPQPVLAPVPIPQPVQKPIIITGAPQPVPIIGPPTKPPLMLDTTKIVTVVGDDRANSAWVDSYSIGDRCYCYTNFDHDIGDVIVSTPLGSKTIREVCGIINGNNPPSIDGRPVYNDIQCGNGPPNTAKDEVDCPGRVDYGGEGCGYIGPKWNFN